MPAVLEKIVSPEQGFDQLLSPALASEITEKVEAKPVAIYPPRYQWVRSIAVTVEPPSLSAIQEWPPQGDVQPGPRETEPANEAKARDAESPNWLQPVTNRLEELLALPFNWDHHGAQSIDERHAISAITFLGKVMSPGTPAPAIVPVGNGTIQLEWHRAGLDVELLVGNRGPEELYFCEIGPGREWEGPAVAGFAEHDLAERLAD